jgi:hypothetical protein
VQVLVPPVVGRHVEPAAALSMSRSPSDKITGRAGFLVRCPLIHPPKRAARTAIRERSPEQM